MRESKNTIRNLETLRHQVTYHSLIKKLGVYKAFECKTCITGTAEDFNNEGWF